MPNDKFDVRMLLLLLLLNLNSIQGIAESLRSPSVHDGEMLEEMERVGRGRRIRLEGRKNKSTRNSHHSLSSAIYIPAPRLIHSHHFLVSLSLLFESLIPGTHRWGRREVFPRKARHQIRRSSRRVSSEMSAGGGREGSLTTLNAIK